MSDHTTAMIGDMLRYGEGETALMVVKHVSPGHGGALARYYGRQCMGGSVGAYHDQCTPATHADRDTWSEHNPMTLHPPPPTDGE